MSKAAIEIEGLSKSYGSTQAVKDLSFTVEPGSVVGFLGPNGSGKTTTLRMLLGLIHPDQGTALVEGERFVFSGNPAGTVGAMLEMGGAHPGRSGRNHLRTLAIAAGIGRDRVEEVLEMVDLSQDAHRRVKGYSLGMKQRLGLAAALLGDPRVLILDEPANGLDPAGVRWLRDTLRGLAEEGRSVLVSSHVLAEVANTADQIIVISNGRSIAQAPVAELIATGEGGVRVASRDMKDFSKALTQGGGKVESTGPDSGIVHGLPPEKIGELALQEKAVLSELSPAAATLEDVFLELTGDDDKADEAKK